MAHWVLHCCAAQSCRGLGLDCSIIDIPLSQQVEVLFFFNIWGLIEAQRQNAGYVQLWEHGCDGDSSIPLWELQMPHCIGLHTGGISVTKEHAGFHLPAWRAAWSVETLCSFGPEYWDFSASFTLWMG